MELLCSIVVLSWAGKHSTATLESFKQVVVLLHRVSAKEASLPHAYRSKHLPTDCVVREESIYFLIWSPSTVTINLENNRWLQVLGYKIKRILQQAHLVVSSNSRFDTSLMEYDGEKWNGG